MIDRVRGVDAPGHSAFAAQAVILLFLLVLLLQITFNAVVFYVEVTVGRYPTMVDVFTGEGVTVYNDLVAAALGSALAIVGAFFALAAVPVAIWIYRAHANLRDAGVGELAYSPGWAVASYFVPGVNLVVPFRAMRELHNRSHGEDVWQAHGTVPDVSSWRTCLIAAAGVLVTAGSVAWLTTIPYLYVVQPPGVNTGLFLFALMLLFGAGVFLFRVVGEVTKAQRQGLHIVEHAA
jgi:hypothetical protein